MREIRAACTLHQEMYLQNEGVCVEGVWRCPLCQQSGSPLYTGLRDRLFDAPGEWSLFQCQKCRLLYLSPRPVPQELGELYATYSLTHDDTQEIRSRAFSLRALRNALKQAVQATTFGYETLLPGSRWRWVGLVGSFIPLLKDAAGGQVMYLRASPRGRLLDVGCGNGAFLARMRDLGWEVLGVEPDSQAARIASQRYNLRVLDGTLEDAGLPAGCMDAVTMNHVIEHAHDPVALLSECRRVLRVRGKLVIVTPNAQSLGHKVFRQSWLLLDPPRHLHLFSLRSIRTCAEKANLQIEILRTMSRSGRGAWLGSLEISRRRVHAWGCDYHPVKELESWVFLAFEEVLRFLWRGAGEELVLVATKV